MKLLPVLPPLQAPNNMERLSLFNPSDLLWRYPLNFHSPAPTYPQMDFKTHLPASLGKINISLPNSLYFFRLASWWQYQVNAHTINSFMNVPHLKRPVMPVVSSGKQNICDSRVIINITA